MVVDMSASGDLEFRTITSTDLPDIIDLVQELRPHIDLPQLQDHFVKSAAIGYEMHAIYRNAKPAALAGFRPVITLSRGRYLHLDDLVVAAVEQKSGTGRLLLAHVENLARQRGNVSVFLDARPTAIPFYAKSAYIPATAPSYWKSLKS